MELFRRFSEAPPEMRPFREDKPTLLVTWWCTAYSITIIAFRICGRYIRTEKIYLEDTIIMLAIIPLVIRTGLIHVVLKNGTNNVNTFGLNGEDINRREVGSQVVLAARIMYASYLWAVKYSVSIYLRSLTLPAWKKSHHNMLRYLHIFLGVTYAGTVIATLAECQPFNHYFQVIPDPGSKCRQAYVQLITTGSMNIVTNLALIIFPIPMILKSSLTQKRKLSVLVRMALPALGIGLTLYQIPTVISNQSLQQYRTLVASFDVLLATFTSNAVILGSLLKDRGYKKEKYKHGPYTTQRLSNDMRRENKRGSDEDLMQPIPKDDDKGLFRMQDLRFDKETGKRMPMPSMPTAKLSEIRVASTWEIKVSDKETG